ncbi:MAG: hypothetical protein AAF639_03535 [Chloroflexota bacterium]
MTKDKQENHNELVHKQKLLKQHKNNQQHLELQLATYAEGEKPTYLTNQLKAEDEAINRLEVEIAELANFAVVKIKELESIQEQLLSTLLASESQLLIQSEKEFGDLALILARDAVLTDLNVRSYNALRSALEQARWQLTIPNAQEIHQGDVFGIAFSLDGQKIVSGGADGTIRIWCSSTLNPLQLFFGHTGRVRSVAWAGDGTAIASASQDGTVRVWDAESGQQRKILKGHSGTVECVAFSPDGQRLVSGGEDHTIRLWDWQNEETIRELKGHVAAIKCVKFSPDGQKIISGSADCTVAVWNSFDGTQLTQFNEHLEVVSAVDVSPNGQWVVSGVSGLDILWDTSELRPNVKESEGNRWKRIFNLVATGVCHDDSHDTEHQRPPTMWIWDIETGEEKTEFHDFLGYVTSLKFSPDGTSFVSGGEDGTIRFWDAQTGSPITQYRNQIGIIWDVAFSPDGQRVACSSSDGKIQLLNTKDGRLLVQSKNHLGIVRSVGVHRDNQQIVSGFGDTKIFIWDIERGAKLNELIGHSDTINSVSFSPDGLRVISGSSDSTVCVWNAMTGKRQALLNVQNNRNHIHSVGFNPNGDQIVAGGFCTIQVWDWQRGKMLLKESNHGTVYAAAFSPDGQWLVASCENEKIRTWDAVKRQELSHLNHPSYLGDIKSIAFSPDSQQIVFVSGSPDNIARIQNVPTGGDGISLQVISDSICSPRFSPSGNQIAGGNSNRIQLWDAKSGEAVAHLDGHSCRVNSVEFTPDGEKIISGSSDGTIRVWKAHSSEKAIRLSKPVGTVIWVEFSPDGERILICGGAHSGVQIRDTYHGELITILDSDISGILSAGFSPDGNQLVTGDYNGKIAIWDAYTGKKLKEFSGHSRAVNAIKFRPDGNWLVSSGDDQTVKLWNTKSKKLINELKGQTAQITSVAFSPDGQYLVTGSQDRKIQIWSAYNGQQKVSVQEHLKPITSVEFSRCGHKVVSSSLDSTIRVWDFNPETPSLIASHRITGHSGAVWSAKFSPNGQRLVSGGADGTARLWEIASGRQLAQIDDHIGDVKSVAFHPNGQQIASGRNGPNTTIQEDDSKNTLFIWDGPERLVLRAIRYTSRPSPILTSAERQRFGIDEEIDLPGQEELKSLMEQSTALSLIEKGHELARDGHVKEATDIFRKAHSLFPESLILDPAQVAQIILKNRVYALLYKGRFYARRHNRSMARAKFEQAAELDRTLNLDELLSHYNC